MVVQPYEVGNCLTARMHKGINSTLDEGQTPVLQPTYGIPGNWIGRQPENGGNAVEPMHDVAPCLTKTDRHGVAQPIPIDLRNAGRDPEKHDAMNRQGVGVGEPGDPAHTVTSAVVHGVAQPMAFDLVQITSAANRTRVEPGLPSGTITKGSNMHVAQPAYTTKMHNTTSNNAGKFFEEYSTCLDANSPPPAVFQPVGTDCYNGSITGDVAATMGTSGSSVNASGPTVMQPVGFDSYNNDVTGDVSKTIDTGQDYHHVPNVLQSVGVEIGPSGGKFTELNPTLDTRAKDGPVRNQLAGAVMQPNMMVRRLTPVECERLQGFPDGYTNIPWRKKDESPDGPRYKALGNSWAVPVVRWIGERIAKAA